MVIDTPHSLVENRFRVNRSAQTARPFYDSQASCGQVSLYRTATLRRLRNQLSSRSLSSFASFG
jgi:hypothetical protein